MTEVRKTVKPVPHRNTAKTAETTGDTVRDYANRAIVGIDANPLAALAGGIVLGVLAGAVVPRSAREAQLLGPLGARLSAGAHDAFDAAKDTGKAQFAGLGLTKDAASDQFGKVMGDVLKALGAAAVAGLAAAKTPNGKPAAEAANAYGDEADQTSRTAYVDGLGDGTPEEPGIRSEVPDEGRHGDLSEPANDHER